MNAESSQVTQKPVFNVKYLPIVLVTSFLSFGSVSFGQEVVDKPLYTTLTADLQPYNDISRGFKLLRPYGYNEFDGSGGYIKKFSSLTEFDENVLIGSVPASADKISVTDYGSLEDVGNKLATKRQNAKIVSSEARKTDGNIFYSYAFEYPIDNSIPRTGSKSNRPTKVVELYELCVAKGKLWSVKATSTDKLFPKHEELFRNTLASFTPRL